MDSSKFTGTVIWFSARLGYGFIKPDDTLEEQDIKVHHKGIVMEGYRVLRQGQKVEYVLEEDTKYGKIAIEVVVLSDQ